MTITSDQFVDSLKRRITMPASQALMNNTDILRMADYATKQKVVPLIKSVRQEYFVVKTREAINVGQREYSIPYRALARTLRDLKLVDSSNGKRDLALIALEDEHLYRTGSLPVGFYFFGDKIVIVANPVSSGYLLEKWWELPPANLVPVSSAARVVTVNVNDVTCAFVPTGITTGSVVDFVKGVQGNNTIAVNENGTEVFDRVVTNVAGNTVSFAPGDVPPTLAPGDYITLAQTTPVLQIPDEAACYLETVTAINVLKAIGDYDGAERLKDTEADEKSNLLMLLEPRIEGEGTKVVNRKSLVRGWRGRYMASGYYY